MSERKYKTDLIPDEKGYVWYDARQEPFDLYGFYSSDPFRRMPDEVAAKANNGVLNQNGHTTGVRVRFSTDSENIRIRVKLSSLMKANSINPLAKGSFDLYEDTDFGSRFAALFKVDSDKNPLDYEEAVKPHHKGFRSYTLNFPLFANVTDLKIGLSADAKLDHGRKYRSYLPIVFYGSSITHGICASRPGLIYENFVSRALDMDYINLGYSGSAKAEPAVREYIAGMDMSVFVCDYDHNAPDENYLRETHLPLYLAVREKHPDIPYIMLTRPDFIYSVAASIPRREVIFDTFKYARAHGDKNVYYIDGDGLFMGFNEDNCTSDSCHPNDIGFMKMGEAVAAVIKRALTR